MEKAVFYWSSGKDSALALYKAKFKYDIKYLLTTVNEEYNRISMHGVRETLLERQAESLGIELLKVKIPKTVTIEQYENIINKQMSILKSDNIDVSIYGDSSLEDLRKYREAQLQKQNIKAFFPLWKKDSRELIEEFISLGFKAVITCVNGSYLPKDFVGKEINEQFIADLPKSVDVCGENGEYHSFVFDGPIFRNRINFEICDFIEKLIIGDNGEKIPYFYCDIK